MYCYKNGNDCPYRKTCKQRTSDGECYKMCVDCNEIDLMMHNANIPHKYVQPIVLYPSCKEDVESFEILSEIKKNIAAMVEQGFNLYIKSNQRQNGKTSWGIKILQNYIHHLIGKPGSTDRALYLDLNEYLIDEVRLSEYERNYLKMIIKSRLANNLSNIFIGRNTAGNLINAIGNDLKYYVEDNSTVISIYGIRGDK